MCVCAVSLCAVEATDVLFAGCGDSDVGASVECFVSLVLGSSAGRFGVEFSSMCTISSAVLGECAVTAGLLGAGKIISVVMSSGSTLLAVGDAWAEGCTGHSV